MFQKIARVKSQFKVFYENYKWLSTDFVAFSSGRFILCIVLAGMSAVIRVVATYYIFKIVKTILSEGLHSSPEIPLIGGLTPEKIGFMIFAAISLQAVIGFLSNKIIFKLGEEFQLDIIHRGLKAYIRKPRIFYPLRISPAEQNAFSTLIVREARNATILTRIILLSVLDILLSLAIYVVLFYLNPTLTLVMSGIVVVFLPVFYFSGKTNISARDRMLECTRVQRLEFRELDDRVKSYQEDDDQIKYDLADHLASSPVSKEAANLHGEMQFSVLRGGLLTSLITAILLAITVSLILSGERQELSSTNTLIYLAALYVMSSFLARSLSAINSSNRFFNTIRYLRQFLEEAPPVVAVKKKHIQYPFREKSLNAWTLNDRFYDTKFQYLRMNGESIPVPASSKVYLYFPSVRHRMGWYPLIERLQATSLPTDEHDGCLVYIDTHAKLKAVVAAFETYAREKPWRQIILMPQPFFDQAEKNIEIKTSLKTLLKISPIFILLTSPLEEGGYASDDIFLYIWGNHQSVLGDYCGFSQKEFPAPAVVRSQVDSNQSSIKDKKSRSTKVEDLSDESY